MTVTNKRLWTVSCLCLPAGAGREGITATHVDGEKVLPVQEIEQRLADLEQARYHIAALESTMLEAGLEIEHPSNPVRNTIDKQLWQALLGGTILILFWSWVFGYI